MPASESRSGRDKIPRSLHALAPHLVIRENSQVGKKGSPPSSKVQFSLGAGQAEADWLLQDAFYETSEYLALASREDRRCFLIARTGGGKSAALQRLEAEHPNHVIRINPEDLSLPYITDLGVIRYLQSLDVHMDSLFIALWKHVLLVEIIRHRYDVDSLAAKQKFMDNLREILRRDPTKVAALEYLDEFQGKFWCEANERLREITNTFETRVTAEAKAHFGAEAVGALTAGIASQTIFSKEERAEQAERFQRIVNETQLARLNKMIGILDSHILDDQHFTFIVIDDLDREWVDEHVANDLIVFLFRTVQDLTAKAKNLKILVALRTNIFEQLNFSERAGAQEEKLRALVLNMRWTRNDLERLLDQRVNAAAERAGLKHDSVRSILPPQNRHRGNPLDYILDRTLLRPRDAIAFVNQAIRDSSAKGRVSWKDIYSAEQSYSKDRLMALRDEWKDPYPGLDTVFELFRRKHVGLSRDALTSVLDEAMLLPATESFRGVRWMTEASRTMIFGASDLGWVDLYQPLLQILFKIGFIGCHPDGAGDPVFVYDDADFVNDGSNLTPECRFTVHPAFHNALD